MNASRENGSRGLLVPTGIFVVLCIALTLEGGEWDVVRFFVMLFIGAIPALFAFLAWVGWEGHVLKRGLLIVGCVLIIAFVAERQRELRRREDARRAQARRDAQLYQAWYNSLTPYQQLEVDNERLREKNMHLERLLSEKSKR